MAWNGARSRKRFRRQSFPQLRGLPARRAPCRPAKSAWPPHQLPEEPPPPNEPPPPEKPPPEKPPPEKPPEPDDQDEPGIIQGPLPPERRRDCGVDAAPPIMKKIKRISAMTKIQVRTGPQSGAASGRFAARAFHSSASPVSTLMMSSTPRLMPPAKSLARKRGVMAFSIMSRDIASVSVPSRP